MRGPARCACSGKIAWTGRGMHVDSVMGTVQPALRCDFADRAAARAVVAGPRRVW